MDLPASVSAVVTFELCSAFFGGGGGGDAKNTKMSTEIKIILK